MNKEDIKAKLYDIPVDYKELLKEEITSPWFKDLVDKVSDLYLDQEVYPEIDDIYTAFRLTPVDKVKVIVIGQDPYINKGQAHGLAFSVKDGVKIPPSLLNIYKELEIEYGYEIPKSGDLTSWAKQGVLLLNSSLTVTANSSLSQMDIGWQKFTSLVIEKLSKMNRDIVYLLFGNYAKKKADVIKNKDAKIIFTSHPSPLSCRHGFFYSNCFKRCNEYLKEEGLDEIDFSRH